MTQCKCVTITGKTIQSTGLDSTVSQNSGSNHSSEWMFILGPAHHLPAVCLQQGLLTQDTTSPNLQSLQDGAKQIMFVKYYYKVHINLYSHNDYMSLLLYIPYSLRSNSVQRFCSNRNLVWGQLLEIPFSIPYAHASRGISKIKLTYNESQVKRPTILGLIKNRRYHTHIPIPFFSNLRWII